MTLSITFEPVLAFDVCMRLIRLTLSGVGDGSCFRQRSTLGRGSAAQNPYSLIFDVLKNQIFDPVGILYGSMLTAHGGY